MPKCELPIQADLIINHPRWEAMVDRQPDAFDIDDETKCQPTDETTLDCLYERLTEVPHWRRYQPIIY